MGVREKYTLAEENKKLGLPKIRPNILDPEQDKKYQKEQLLGKIINNKVSNKTEYILQQIKK